MKVKVTITIPDPEQELELDDGLSHEEIEEAVAEFAADHAAQTHDFTWDEE